jgi:cell division inhibitor SepF
MGFLDNLRDRFGGGYNDDYDDDYYDDYDDDGDDEPTGSGILGNTSRPEAESVSVYTRSGRPVGTNAGGQSGSSAPSRPSASYSSYRRNNDDFDDDLDDYKPAPKPSYTPSSAAGSLNASGQLPPYVLRAEAYEDVQAVVRRVRTNQPVLLVLNDTDPDIAQRILDFSFGLSFGIGGEVQPVDSKAFLVLPSGIKISQSEIDRLLMQAK